MDHDISFEPPFRMVTQVEKVIQKITNLVFTYPRQRLNSEFGLPIDDELGEADIDVVSSIVLARLTDYFRTYIAEVTIDNTKSYVVKSQTDNSINAYDIHLYCVYDNQEFEYTATIEEA